MERLMSKFDKLIAVIAKLRKQITSKEKWLQGLTEKKKQNDEIFVEQLAQSKLAKDMTAYNALAEDDHQGREKKIDEILKFLSKLPDDEKLVLGKYLYCKQILSGCQGIFGYKNPTSCGGCHRGRRNVELAKVEKFVKFYGDRVYGIPKEIFEEALARLKSSDDLIKQKTLTDEITSLKDEVITQEGIASAINSLKDKGQLAYEQMEDFILFLANIKRVSFVDCDLDSRVGLVINEETYYRAGCEYGVTFTVYRDGKSKSEYFKWRDGYSERQDDPGANYRKASITSVTDQQVKIELESKSRKTNRTFDLPKIEKKVIVNLPLLTSAQQKSFSKRYREEKKKLLDQHWRKTANYADYIDFRKMSGQLPMGCGPSGRQIPYTKSEVVEELVRTDIGQAVLIIKAQIDAAVGRGKQHEWVVYLVTSDKTEQLTRCCAYEAELEGGSRIELRAANYIDK